MSNVAFPAIQMEQSPVYDAPCRLLDWKHGAREGMTVDLRLTFPGPSGGHAFRGIATGKENGQRFRLRVSFPRQPDGALPPSIYEGESLLMRWSENDRTGMMVRFLLDDGPDGVQGRHPFFGLSTGRMTGEPLEMAAWGIADDDQSMPPSRLRQQTPFHKLTEVRQSQILARDARFRGFLRSNLTRFVPDEAQRQAILVMNDSPEQFAAAAIRAALGVSSRAIMNMDGSAALSARNRWREILSEYEDAMWGRRGY